MNKNWNLVYLENTKLDLEFETKYKELTDMYQKNCIELLVEISEFINETKCFKYWSIKKPEYDKVYEECADVICMILYYYDYFKIKSVTTTRMQLTSDLMSEINKLYIDATKLIDKGSVNITKKIYTRFMHICKLLNLSEEEILKSCYRKININIDRLNSDY